MFPLDQAHMESGSGIPRTEDLFDLDHTDHTSLFGSLDQVWEVLPRISDYLLANLRPGQLGQAHGQAVIEGDVFIGEGTLIEAGALVHGPVWIGRNCRIGHGATLRSNVIIGRDCVLYPNVTFTGVLPAKRLVKNRSELVVVEKRETFE